MKRNHALKHQKRLSHSRPRRNLMKKMQQKVQRRRMHFPTTWDIGEDIQLAS